MLKFGKLFGRRKKEMRTKSGLVLADDEIKALADEAEAGYDVSRIRPLGPPGPTRKFCDECGAPDKSAHLPTCSRSRKNRK